MSGSRLLANDLFDVHVSHWVVEVLVFIVPLNSEIMLAAVFQSFVDWGKVVRSAHRRDPGVCRLISRLVLELKTSWVPAGLYPGIGISCTVVISVDSLQNCKVCRGNVGCESVLEDYLEVRIVAQVGRVVCWGGSSFESNVLKRKVGGLI